MDGSGDGGVAGRLRAKALQAGDGFGWYAELLAGTATVVPHGHDPEFTERVIRLAAAGFLGPEVVARLLAPRAGTDPDRVVRLLESLAGAGHSWRSVWGAMPLCGEAGLRRLEQAIREEEELTGAAGVLQTVDPQRAVLAVRDRVLTRGRSVEASDAGPLRLLSENDVELLGQMFRRHPDRLGLAQMLGWTEKSAARRILLDPQLLHHPDEVVRQVLVHGLRAFCGRRSDAEVDGVILALVKTDPSRNVRMVARATLEVRALIFPSAAVRLAEQASADELVDDPQLAPLVGTAQSLAGSLRVSGPRLRWALTVVEQHPQLLDDPSGPIAVAVEDLAVRTLEGRFGMETVLSLCAILGAAFAGRAVDALGRDRTGRLHPLAVALARGVPDDEAVFAAVTAYAGRYPMPMTTAVIAEYRLDPGLRVDKLLRLLETLVGSRPEAVQVWSSALRTTLVDDVDDQSRALLRDRIDAATEHVLSLLPAPDPGDRLISGTHGRAANRGGGT